MNSANGAHFGGYQSWFLLNCLRAKNMLKEVKVSKWAWKSRKGHGKSHGKLWNLKNSKKFEPSLGPGDESVSWIQDLRNYQMVLKLVATT